MIAAGKEIKEAACGFIKIDRQCETVNSIVIVVRSPSTITPTATVSLCLDFLCDFLFFY